MIKQMIFKVGDGMPGPRKDKLKEEKKEIIEDIFKKIPNKKPITPGKTIKPIWKKPSYKKYYA